MKMNDFNESVNSFLLFAEDQQAYHAKHACRRDVPAEKASRHRELAEKFSVLRGWLAKQAEAEQARVDPFNMPKKLRLGDLSDLPKELLDDLNLTTADEAETQIQEVVASFGGVAAVDEIMVGLWRRFNIIFKRQPLASKLYRMTKKELLHSVPQRRGLYSLDPVIVPVTTDDVAED
jgi:hypothetical protein